MNRLSQKEQGFIKDIVAGIPGVHAALNNYDTTSYNTAGAIASENLKKPKIVEAIRSGLKDSQIEEAFDKLINLKRLDYFVFPKSMNDEEIKEHVEAQGITCLNVRPTEKGKMAFFAIPDGAALAKALDIWAKINDAYAAQKHINVNVNAEPNERIKELAKKLNK